MQCLLASVNKEQDGKDMCFYFILNLYALDQWRDPSHVPTSNEKGKLCSQWDSASVPQGRSLLYQMRFFIFILALVYIL